MRIFVLVFFTLLLSVGCTATQKERRLACSAGTTDLDGVCVRQEVADYVSCVRAQGTELDSSKRKALSAEAGYLAIKARGAEEVSSSLKRRYEASDAAMLAIIDNCNSILGSNSFKDKNTQKENTNVSFTGIWDTKWGLLMLKQIGNEVTGSYTFRQGKISGTVKGNILIGEWSQAPTYSPPNAGEIKFVLAQDGQSYIGNWRNGYMGNWKNDWSGKLVARD
jgi:hypothetical protein